MKECVELEEMFGCVVVQKLLEGKDVDFRSMKKVTICRKIATYPCKNVRIKPL